MNRGTEQRLVERRDRGLIRHAGAVYGASVEGVPLTVYHPDSGSAEIVIQASIHGDEPETTVVVSEALRCLPSSQSCAQKSARPNNSGCATDNTKCFARLAAKAAGVAVSTLRHYEEPPRSSRDQSITAPIGQ
jgi:hypothetical protein